jgi:flavin reductase (DIM6/NTAB) family NADH-FMN oxidoreductase RutF
MEEAQMSKISLKPGPYVVPMPVALVGVTVAGKPNFMPAAFLGIMNYDPPIVAAGSVPPTTHVMASPSTGPSV